MMSGILITPRVLRWVRKNRPARILHLFAGGCNLINDQGEIISLVSPRIGPGPFTIMFENEFHAGTDENQIVSIDNARQILAVGAFVVDMAQAAIWQPKPDWTQWQAAAVAGWLPPGDLSPELDASLKQTLIGFVAGDLSTCLAGVKGLAGRGSGLTPAGDDVLMGVLYGLWVWHPLREWMERIIETAIPLTTTLSANFLRAAADGEAAWPWHDLVEGRPHAVGRILSIGHTSGADAWAGFIHTGSVLSAALRRNEN